MNNTDKNRDYILGRFDSDGIKAPESLSEESIFAMLPDHNSIEDTNNHDETAHAQSVSTAQYDSGKQVGTVIYDSDRSQGDAETGTVVFENASDDSSPADGGKNAASGRRKIFTRANAKRWVAVAACLIAAIVSVPVVHNVMTAPPDTALVDGELKTFGSYTEIENLVRSMSPEEHRTRTLLRLGSSDDMVDYYEEDADMMVNESAAGDSAMDTGGNRMASKKPNASIPSTAGTGSSDRTSHSSTYLQVEEVDEADIIKTDGKYIYYVTDSQEVMIMSADKGRTELLSRIGNTNIENYVENIYLKGDILVTAGKVYDEDDGYTAVVTYDITDRSKPEVISEFRQSGDIVSSRMVGNYVYLVTNDYVYNGGRVIPKCTVNGDYTSIPAGDICCVPEPAQTSYVILSAIDITSGKKAAAKTHAVFGASNDIYCNDHNLYAAVSEYDYEKGTSYTRVIRAKLDGLDIRFDATSRVRGYINDQFSMDEDKGYLRIATTSERNGMDVNNLFILDDHLREAGKITGFARNESIKAVRYIGDMAYVITYKAIDPLFVMDLSDPANPVIRGEVKIDGFSSLLVPAGKGRMLGIGYATGDNGFGGEYSAGLKLALFDISDPLKPEVLSSKEFKDMDSPAQNEHKALTVNTEEGWYAVPYGQYLMTDDEEDDIIIDEDAEADVLEESDEEPVDEPSDEFDEPEDPSYESGVLVFGAEDKIKVYDQHKLGSDDLQRCIYIGNYIYALDSEGSVSSFRFTKKQ